MTIGLKASLFSQRLALDICDGSTQSERDAVFSLESPSSNLLLESR